MRTIFAGLMLFAFELAFAQIIDIEPLPALQQPVSNNAVALVATEEGVYLYSFLGLGSGKTWRDTSAAACVLKPGAKTWTQLSTVPGGSGRLAASAISAGGAAWLFGGYTVAADGSEKSIPGVYRIRPGETELQWVTDMPVPVEDSVLLVYQDRYIYLVSGWHDLGNVNLVQVLDTQSMQWTQATPWPGEPVFGHSGGISKAQMLLCDGVKINYQADDKPREFLPSKQCWSGRIDTENHRRIHWQPVPAHPGEARYRMAATGDADERVVFAGGAVNPYNFNGIGYNGKPAETETSVFSYSFATRQWQVHGHLPKGTMDHRGLPYSNSWYYLVGGMHEDQAVVADVYRFRIGNSQDR
jgi:N-acetylneuraminic acid mutarotase